MNPSLRGLPIRAPSSSIDISGNVSLFHERVNAERDESTQVLLNAFRVFLEGHHISSRSDLNGEAHELQIVVDCGAVAETLWSTPLECQLIMKVQRPLKFVDVFKTSTTTAVQSDNDGSVNTNGRKRLIPPIGPDHAYHERSHTTSPSHREPVSQNGIEVPMSPMLRNPSDRANIPNQFAFNHVLYPFRIPSAANSLQAVVPFERPATILLNDPAILSQKPYKGPVVDQSGVLAWNAGSTDLYRQLRAEGQTNSMSRTSSYESHQLQTYSNQSGQLMSRVETTSSQSVGQFSDPGSLWASSVQLTQNSGFAYGNTSNQRGPKEGYEVPRVPGTVGRTGGAVISVPSGLSEIARAPMSQAEIFRQIQEQEARRAQLQSVAEEKGKEG